MISLNEIQKMLGYPETQTTAEDEIFFDEQETEMIISIIKCFKNYPIISAKDAYAITKYNNVINQVKLCLKAISEASYKGKDEAIFYLNNPFPITKHILMCLGYEISDIPTKRISIKWWYNLWTRLLVKSL